MADDTTDPNGGTPGVTGNFSADEGMPMVQILGQYIKDLSFENPGAGRMQRPQIELAVDLGVKPVEGNRYEVILKLRVAATESEKTMFLLELAYGGVFALERVPQDALEPFLLIECPRLMFPFARRIVADLVTDGGLPPLMIEPIDFAQLYRQRLMQQQQQGQPPQQV